MRQFFAAVTLLQVAAASLAVGADGPPSELVAVGSPPTTATLEAVTHDGDLRFRDSAGEAISLKVDRLIRWSNVASPRAADELVLRDGGRLGLAADWGKQPSITFDGERGEARTAAFGRVPIDRSSVRAILWQLPPDETRRGGLIDDLLTPEVNAGGADRLLLDNGDILSGTLERIASSSGGDGEKNAVVTFSGNLGTLELPIDRVRGVVLRAVDGQSINPRVKPPTLLVALNDGSRIAATTMQDDNGKLVLESDLLGKLPISDIDRVASLQGLRGRANYLSDLEPIAYRQEPYLDLAWQYRRDRSALGEPLRVGGRVFAKGLGMHSAARLTYALDGAYDRFVACVAVDDAAEGHGSVVFRVFLNSGGQWRETYASGVVRSGEPPREVAVELGGADQLALVVDYADRGDERDYADWLDARLERTAP